MIGSLVKNDASSIAEGEPHLHVGRIFAHVSHMSDRSPSRKCLIGHLITRPL